jgi:hypothetical protein
MSVLSLAGSGDAAIVLAFIDHPASAYCNELVEVAGLFLDMALIRNTPGRCSPTAAWEPANRLKPPPPPLACPHGRTVVAALYREIMGRAPPPGATPGLIWAAVQRALDPDQRPYPFRPVRRPADRRTARLLLKPVFGQRRRRKPGRIQRRMPVHS